MSSLEKVFALNACEKENRTLKIKSCVLLRKENNVLYFKNWCQKGSGTSLQVPMYHIGQQRLSTLKTINARDDR